MSSSSTSGTRLAWLGLLLAQACASAAPLGGEDGTRGEPAASGGSAVSSGGSSVSGSGNSATNGAGNVSAGGGAAAAFAGGSNENSAGSSGASSGASAGASSVPATPATDFGRVTSLLRMRCAGSKCHSSGAQQLAFANATGSALYSLLTMPIASGISHCVGVTLVTPNDPNSPLLQIVKSGGKIACTKPKTENVGPMPDKCTTTSTSVTGVCLTAAEITVISDWISAGAPQE